MGTTPLSPTQNHTLLWTADSPFCRIVLWACAAEINPRIVFEHLSWADLSLPQTRARLGKEQTIPCLLTPSGPVTDSLRILAFLKGDGVSQWLESQDGALYRCAEGHLARVMYACYDGAADEKCAQLWVDALAACARMQVGDNSVSRPVKVSWGLMAVHTFVSFCVGLRPQFRSEIPEALRELLIKLETLPSFIQMSQTISGFPHKIRCGIYWAAEAGSGLSGGAAR